MYIHIPADHYISVSNTRNTIFMQLSYLAHVSCDYRHVAVSGFSFCIETDLSEPFQPLRGLESAMSKPQKMLSRPWRKGPRKSTQPVCRL